MNDNNKFRIFDIRVCSAVIEGCLGLIIEEERRFRTVVKDIKVDFSHAEDRLAVGDILKNFEHVHKIPFPIEENGEVIDFENKYVEDIHVMDDDMYFGDQISCIEQPDIFNDLMELEKNLEKVIENEDESKCSLIRLKEELSKFNESSIEYRKENLNEFCMQNLEKNEALSDINYEYNIFVSHSENMKMLLRDLSAQFKKLNSIEKDFIKFDPELYFYMKSVVNNIYNAFEDDFNIEKMEQVREVLNNELYYKIKEAVETYDEEYRKRNSILRKTNELDIDKVMDIINEAKLYFKEQGIDQWQNGYPNEDTILKDIQDGHAFVLEKNNEILGTVMYTLEGESTYDSIYNGKWLTDGKYAVIHRIAVSNKHKGSKVAATILGNISEMAVREGVHSIKIDTHKDNISMQRFLKKCEFEYCGEIYLNDGSLRMAFEKIIK